MAGDLGRLLAELHRLAVHCGGADAPDPDLLLQDEAPFHDEHLLHHRNDRYVALLADVGRSVDNATNGNALDLNGLTIERLLDQRLAQSGGRRDENRLACNTPPIDSDSLLEHLENGRAGAFGVR